MGLEIRDEKSKGIVVVCDGQDVLRIDENSDDDTINFYLYPMGKGDFKSSICDCRLMDCCNTHDTGRFQVLCFRNDKSRQKLGIDPIDPKTKDKHVGYIKSLRSEKKQQSVNLCNGEIVVHNNMRGILKIDSDLVDGVGKGSLWVTLRNISGSPLNKQDDCEKDECYEIFVNPQ